MKENMITLNQLREYDCSRPVWVETTDDTSERTGWRMLVFACDDTECVCAKKFGTDIDDWHLESHYGKTWFAYLERK